MIGPILNWQRGRMRRCGHRLPWLLAAALGGCTGPAAVDRAAAPIEVSRPASVTVPSAVRGAPSTAASAAATSGAQPAAATPAAPFASAPTSPSAPAPARAQAPASAPLPASAPTPTPAPAPAPTPTPASTTDPATATAQPRRLPADAAAEPAANPFPAQATPPAPAAPPGATPAPRAAPSPSAAPPSSSSTAEIPPDALPGWREDSLDALHDALSRQCALRRPPEPWPALCAELPPPTALKAWIASRFIAEPLSQGGSGTGLLTGYYEPVLTGSRQRERTVQVPLYRRPADLAVAADGLRQRRLDGELRPYPTRQQIETEGLLAGQELVWLDDPIEAFFVQVQGSGRVRLRDGSTLRVGYADHNGQPYYAIGRELIARGELSAEAVDADAIKAWLRANPAQAEAVMHSNPRYIFFRELPPSADGPPGSLGVPLTPLRSVATDPAHVPPGALLFLDSTHPDDGRPMRRLVVSQDRGAAITGAVRADLYWGTGDEAGRLAGRTRQPARIWLLKPAVPQQAR
ncbi:MAG: murein transglycosylase A [Burkholderiaceae bacterium]